MLTPCSGLCQDGAGSVWQLCLTWNPATISFMNGCNLSPIRFHQMHRQIMLMLHWYSVSELGIDCVDYSVARKGCWYMVYWLQQPVHSSITILKRLKSDDALLTLIFRMWKWLFWYYLCHGRQPISRLWMVATNHPLDCPRYTAKNLWYSIYA